MQAGSPTLPWDLGRILRSLTLPGQKTGHVPLIACILALALLSPARLMTAHSYEILKLY